ncbi:MAG: flavin reductase family protein, partial [Alphaproteobacteria bacterium]
ALGRFATGVTVVAAKAPEGGLVGVTINSFSSVSLDPPLVLWSLDRQSPSLPPFESVSHYCISVLTADQLDLCHRFASPDLADAGTDMEIGANGAPRLRGCLAWYACRNRARHDGGDHVIFIGEVEEFGYREGRPLVFFSGRFGSL